MRAITVITGGSTPERDVALAGAAQVVLALRERGHQVSVVDTTRGELRGEAEAEFLTTRVNTTPPSHADLEKLRVQELGPRLVELPVIKNADVNFLVLHGQESEGGALQAMFDLSHICYTGSGPLGSALAMDKDMSKRILRDANIATPAWQLWPTEMSLVEALGLPLIVKPSKVGSSVGLTLLHDTTALDAAVAKALTYDDEVLLEQFIEGPELTVGILNGRALGVGGIIPSHDLFDYECKYTPGCCEEVFPAQIDRELTERIQTIGLDVHVALKLRDFSRVDIRMDADGVPYCLEANTLPGLTATSLLPQSARSIGMEFGELCESICESAYNRKASGTK